jgi:alkaline phosphatase
MLTYAGSKGETCCPVTRVANTLEACRAKGMATGIVVTTVLPHATPGAWSLSRIR